MWLLGLRCRSGLDHKLSKRFLENNPELVVDKDYCYNYHMLLYMSRHYQP